MIQHLYSSCTPLHDVSFQVHCNHQTHKCIFHKQLFSKKKKKEKKIFHTVFTWEISFGWIWFIWRAENCSKLHVGVKILSYWLLVWELWVYSQLPKLKFDKHTASQHNVKLVLMTVQIPPSTGENWGGQILLEFTCSYKVTNKKIKYYKIIDPFVI